MKPRAIIFAVLLISACGKTSDHQAPSPIVNEPEAYRATIVYSYLPGNNRGLKPNELFRLEVARRGPERQYAFNFGGRKLSYLEGPQQHFLISPDCREYADTTLEAMNFRIPGALAPEQLIARLAQTRDLRYLGEEQLDGRTAAKYAAPHDRVIYVDKSTGLPLRTEVETEVSAPSKGLVPIEEKGKLNVIVEVRDIRTEVDASVFQLPKEIKEVEQSALCAEVGRLAESAMQLLWTVSDKRSSKPES